MVVNVATPPDNVPVPRVVAPSRNVTVPVGVPPDPVTVAVKVTDCPETVGLTLDYTTVVVLTLFTVCVSAVLVLVLKIVSPEYTPVMV